MRIIFLFVFLLLSAITCSAQMLNYAARAGGMALKYNLNLGAEYSSANIEGLETNNVRFAGSASYPIYHKKNKLNTYISSGIDYTGGRSEGAGLNLKPVQVTTFFNESFINNHPYTVLLSCDAGYIFNFKHGNNGIVITPNLYVDYKCFFVRTGYNFNISEGDRQFFVRAGVSFGMGVWKMLPFNYSIW